MYKKADGGLVAILVIIIIIIVIGCLANMGWKECRTDTQCGQEHYCGSDFTCHKIPVIIKENNPVIVQRNYMGPAWVIGIAMIVTAIIFNFDKIFTRRKVRGREKVYTNIPVYYENGSK